MSKVLWASFFAGRRLSFACHLASLLALNLAPLAAAADLECSENILAWCCFAKLGNTWGACQPLISTGGDKAESLGPTQALCFINLKYIILYFPLKRLNV